MGHVARQPELSGPPELPALSASGQEQSGGGTGVEQREEGWEEKWEEHPALHEDEILRLLQQQAQSYREELRSVKSCFSDPILNAFLVQGNSAWNNEFWICTHRLEPQQVTKSPFARA